MTAEFLDNKFRKFPSYTSPARILGTNLVSTPFIVQILAITPCVVMVINLYLDSSIHERFSVWRNRQRAIYIALILDLQNIVFICNSMCILKISIMRSDKELYIQGMTE